MRRTAALLVAGVSLAGAAPVHAAEALAQSAAIESGAWLPARWGGEDALQSTSGEWRAIVSLVRARLVYFGPADESENLVYAPPTRDDPAGWGGHRVWLGPQTTWDRFWPPPAAWEHRAAATVRTDRGTLVLEMPDAGRGWARVTRHYSWRDDALVCAVTVKGGTRAGQIVQIVQIPSRAEIRAVAAPDEHVPFGFVQLPLGLGLEANTRFEWPAQATREGDHRILLRQGGPNAKLGFPPQRLTARIGDLEVELSRDTAEGRAVASPDEGFYSQVYLSAAGESFCELEQLSPTWAAGEPASFSILLRARHANAVAAENTAARSTGEEAAQKAPDVSSP